MKKFKNGVIVLFLCLFGFVGVANAECDNQTIIDLNTKAANVKATYDTKQIVVDEDGNPVSNADASQTEEQDSEYSTIDTADIEVLNITEDLSFTITNTDDKTVIGNYSYSDTTDGTFTYQLKDLDKIRNFSIEIYSNNSSCVGTKLRTVTLTTPKYNSYSELSACYGSTEYYCQKYVTVDINMTTDEIIKKAIDSKTTDETENKDQTTEQSFWSKYKLYIIIGSIVIILAGVGVGFTVVQRKRSRAL